MINSVEILEARKLFAFGQVNTAWGTAGRVITDVGTQDVTVERLVVSSGKIYAAGDAAILRYNADGTLDSSFGSSGKVSLSDGHVVQTLAPGDGNLYLLLTGNSGTSVLKLRSNGTRDTTFGTTGVALVSSSEVNFRPGDFSPTAMAYAGGKILVAGSRVLNLGNAEAQVYRLKGNGALDGAFGGDGAVELRFGLTTKKTPYTLDQITDIVALSNGEMVMSGGSQALAPQSDPNAAPIIGRTYLAEAKFTARGLLDPSFGDNGTARAEIAYDRDLRSRTTSAPLNFVGRLRADGSGIGLVHGTRLSVSSFRSDGAILFNTTADAGFQMDNPSDVQLLSDGRAIVTGVASPAYLGHGPALAEVFSDGTFGPYALTDDLKASTVELIDDDPQNLTDQFFRPHPLAVANDGELLVGGGPKTGSGFEIEKIRPGNVGDPRPDVFSSGTVNDLVRDNSGGLHLAYFDETTSTLKYAHRLINGQWTAPVSVDSTQFSGDYLSIGVDSHDQPAIAYHDGLHGDLKYAKSSDSGKTWNTQTVDSAGSTGLYPSMVIDAASGTDQVMISYYRKTTGDLKFASQNPDGSWSTELVDTSGNVGRSSRLFQYTAAFTPQPVVAYVDYTHDQVKFAQRKANGGWAKQVVASLQGAADYLYISYGRYTPAITFYDAYSGDLKEADRSSPTQWDVSTTATKGAVGLYEAATFFDRLDPTVHLQIYAYDKTTNSVSLYVGAETGAAEVIPQITSGGKYLSLARTTLQEVMTGDAAYIDTSRSALRVGTVLPPIDDRTESFDNGDSP